MDDIVQYLRASGVRPQHFDAILSHLHAARNVEVSPDALTGELERLTALGFAYRVDRGLFRLADRYLGNALLPSSSVEGEPGIRARRFYAMLDQIGACGGRATRAELIARLRRRGLINVGTSMDVELREAMDRNLVRRVSSGCYALVLAEPDGSEVRPQGDDAAAAPLPADGCAQATGPVPQMEDPPGREDQELLARIERAEAERGALVREIKEYEAARNLIADRLVEDAARRDALDGDLERMRELYRMMQTTRSPPRIG